MIERTIEQLDILDVAGGDPDNMMIEALAGCGKSATLLMIERAVLRQPILYLVFNTANAEKIASLEQLATERKKVTNGSPDPATRCLPTTAVRTLNSIGHRIWADSHAKRLAVDPKKSGTILKGMLAETKSRKYRDQISEVWFEVTSAVSLAKALGYIPDGIAGCERRLVDQAQFLTQLDEEPDDITIELIDAVLAVSIRQAFSGTIDFNDQVYMPSLFGGIFPKFPLVLVDEYQDLSPTNHSLLARLVRGRVIGVGDPYQNIYGFRGAKAQGMAEATKAYSCTELPLSTSFRCPSEIVRNVHWRVPHFRWLTEGGSVERPDRLRFDVLPDEITVISRNNAPLFRLAMQLLAQGRSVSMAGTDLGPRLVGIMRKLGSEDRPRGDVLTAIDEWLDGKLTKESKTAEDLAECMRVFARHGKTLGAAIAYAEHLFAQRGRILLTTGHKAKGLEWNTVIHLDPWLVRRNLNEQEQNLDYVISTRSRDRLIEIDTDRIEW